MSSSRITKVKGVSPNFMAFFWNNMGNVRIAQIQGDYSTAIKLMATFISYLPDDMRKKFKERKTRILHSMNLITSDQLPEIRKIRDPFMRQIYKDRLLNTYSYEALDDFINALSTELTRRGYLEITSKIEGSGSDGTRL